MEALGLLIVATLIGFIFARGLRIAAWKFFILACLITPCFALYRQSVQHDLVATFLECLKMGPRGQSVRAKARWAQAQSPFRIMR